MFKISALFEGFILTFKATHCIERSIQAKACININQNNMVSPTLELNYVYFIPGTVCNFVISLCVN